jgi:prolyl-tRNA synthetase
MANVITPRSEDYARWYTDVVTQSQMADYSPVKGCMVIRPLGYALWEAMQRDLDARFKETGHQNAYFPLFIPESFLHREARHVEGFSPETAVVTHAGGSKLEEPLVVRPTSETIIYAMFSKWIRSYRDLPLLYNQWANVVRWEMRTRLFLRTTEFLWQEGHTAHATEADAEEEALKILEIYRRFAEERMAIPVYSGIKTESEKFAGALRTYCIEGLMQDGKALQAGTSHNLGQNFAKAFDVKFQTKEGQWAHVWQTSWGVSTRLVGAIVMAHGDDNGLVLPPRLAPVQVVIVPIWKTDAERSRISEAARLAAEELKGAFRVTTDLREEFSPGWKFNEWELKGVPLRIEIGPRDLARGEATVVRRLNRAKQTVALGDLGVAVPAMLEEIQAALRKRALDFREAHTVRLDSLEALVKFFETSIGFVITPWCGRAEDERTVSDRTTATTRVILSGRADGPCAVCGRPASLEVAWGKAY